LHQAALEPLASPSPTVCGERETEVAVRFLG
jgi:hypothetical protein